MAVNKVQVSKNFIEKIINQVWDIQVFYAGEMTNEGMDAAEVICNLLNELADQYGSYTVDDMVYDFEKTVEECIMGGEE